MTVKFHQDHTVLIEVQTAFISTSGLRTGLSWTFEEWWIVPASSWMFTIGKGSLESYPDEKTLHSSIFSEHPFLHLWGLQMSCNRILEHGMQKSWTPHVLSQMWAFSSWSWHLRRDPGHDQEEVPSPETRLVEINQMWFASRYW